MTALGQTVSMSICFLIKLIVVLELISAAIYIAVTTFCQLSAQTGLPQSNMMQKKACRPCKTALPYAVCGELNQHDLQR